MTFRMTAFPMDASNHALTNKLDFSNKILISSTVLPEIDFDCGTTYFRITNANTRIDVICAMHEYIDIPGVCFLPRKIMERLGIRFGDMVSVCQFKEAVDGTHMKIKPHQKKFIELDDPRSILEMIISEQFPILSVGDVIAIKYREHVYSIEIVTCNSKTIRTTNCDINLEFDRPLDMPAEGSESTEGGESKSSTASNSASTPTFTPASASASASASNCKPVSMRRYSRMQSHMQSPQSSTIKTRTAEDLRRFPGKGYRLGSS